MSYSSEVYHKISLIDKHYVSRKEMSMFINKASDGKNNISGSNIFIYRKQLRISQRELADRLQLAGINVDKNAIQRIEAGKRFVTDIELIALAQVLAVDIEDLLRQF